MDQPVITIPDDVIVTEVPVSLEMKDDGEVFRAMSDYTHRLAILEIDKKYAGQRIRVIHTPIIVREAELVNKRIWMLTMTSNVYIDNAP